MVPAYYQSWVPFGVIAVNTILFGLLRGLIGRPLDPNPFQWLILEFVATMEFCVNCAELEIIYGIHGVYVFALTLFILCFMWSQMWFKARSTPCDPIEDIVWRQDTVVNSLARIAGQLLAAALAYRYARLIWSYNLIAQHKKAHKTLCKTALQVSAYRGFAIEMTISLISLLVQLESQHINAFHQGVLNAATSVGLVLAALSTTGGFINPAAATALKFDCAGTGRVQFFGVYWLGAIAGSLAARAFHAFLHKPRAASPSTSTSSSSSTSSGSFNTSSGSSTSESSRSSEPPSQVPPSSGSLDRTNAGDSGSLATRRSNRSRTSQ